MGEEKSRNRVRSNVGVRNPYPLAEAILLRRGKIETRIDWEELDFEKTQDYLLKAFRKPFRELFDPQFRSPLYAGLPRRGMKGGLLQVPEKRRRPGPMVGSGASPCTAVINDWIPNTANDDWTYPPGPPPFGGDLNYGLDIMQGCAPDCYFIAALISLAWIRSSPLTGGNDDPAVSGNKLYPFYQEPINTGSTSPKSTAKSLPVDAGEKLVFAHPTDNQSIWPSVYEKAYGMFRGLDQDKPDISQLGFWNPLTALWEVSGISVDARFLKSYPATTPTPTQKFNTAKIFGEICSKGGMSPGLKTKRPMVAWTFLDGTQTPYSDAFTNDLIVGNHAYSILGTTFVSGMGNCIVLRNPYGISKVTTSIPGVSSCKPTWSPVSLQISQGNFAMTTEPFTHYFEGFCYTTV